MELFSRWLIRLVVVVDLVMLIWVSMWMHTLSDWYFYAAGSYLFLLAAVGLFIWLIGDFFEESDKR